MNSYIKEVLDGLRARYPWESEFLQATEEVLESITPLIEAEPKYRQQKILERIVEPERVVMFRVPLPIQDLYHTAAKPAMMPYAQK